MAKDKRKVRNYDDMDEGITRQTEDSFERRESSGPRKSCLDLPEGYGLFTAKEGTHWLDIIPFFAGPNHPQSQEDQATYLLEFYQHTNVGPGKDVVVCLEKTLGYRGAPKHLVEKYGRRCPICEYRAQRLDEGLDYKSKLAKNLKAKRRVAYNVIVYDNNKEQDKGIQIWEVAHYFAEKNISAISKSGRGGEIIPFASPKQKKGRTVKFEVTGTKTEQAYQGFVLEPRDYDIDEEFLDQALTLDEFLVFHEFDEIKEMFFDGLDEDAGTEPEDEEDNKSRGKKKTEKGRGKSEEAFDADSDDEDEGPEDEGEKKPSRGRGRDRGSEDQEDEPSSRKRAPKNKRQDDDEDEEPAPRSRGRKAASEDDEDEEEPAPKSSKRGRKPVDDEDGEEPAPKPSRNRKPAKDEAEEDEEPAPKSSRRRASADDEDSPPAKKDAKPIRRRRNTDNED